MTTVLNSLTGRLLLASALLLPLLLGTTGFYLDRSQRLGIEAAQSERLQLQILTLLAEAEFDTALRLPEQLLEARLNQPESGLYALVSDDGGQVLWFSPSALILDTDQLTKNLPELPTGQRDFSRRDGLFHSSLQVLWESESGAETALMFTVLESVAPADAQLGVYRSRLLGWLGGSALLLLITEALVLLWGLQPLRKLATEINDIESGAAEALSRGYPKELQTVTESLNMLLSSEQKRRERSRNMLSDLAHSLKTPLAVIRSANSKEPNYDQLVQEQSQRMEEIVAYQLQRAVGGSHKLLQVIHVAPVLSRLQATLHKVYEDKGVAIEIQTTDDCIFRGDERDLLELAGILMDNACKYGKGKVRVSATGGGTRPLILIVEDNGDGIPEALRKLILERGIRADSQQAGQGIGLAVAVDLAQSYLGNLDIEQGSLGGACLRVELR